jgi:PAS domain-containing protein
MAGTGLGFRRVEGIGERSVSGTLAGLLSLTSDAVLAFDGFGRILMANEAAEHLFGRQDLVGADVRALFPPAAGVVPDDAFDPRALPFSTDGSTSSLVVVGAAGAETGISVRCDRVSAPGETYLLVAYEDDSRQAEEREHDRLVQELSRANHRLSGTLSIVLETLDSRDVQTLFSRVLEEITDTMDATGTVFYVAEADGYHLRGTSSSLGEARVPRFMSFGAHHRAARLAGGPRAEAARDGSGGRGPQARAPGAAQRGERGDARDLPRDVVRAATVLRASSRCPSGLAATCWR